MRQVLRQGKRGLTVRHNSPRAVRYSVCGGTPVQTGAGTRPARFKRRMHTHVHARVITAYPRAVHAHTHAHAHARTDTHMHPPTNTHTHARARARKQVEQGVPLLYLLHARTHTRLHTLTHGSTHARICAHSHGRYLLSTAVVFVTKPLLVLQKARPLAHRARTQAPRVSARAFARAC